MKYYRQCELRKDNTLQTCWIEEYGAKQGNSIKLKDQNDEIWKVKNVFGKADSELVQELSSDYRTQRKASDI